MACQKKNTQAAPPAMTDSPIAQVQSEFYLLQATSNTNKSMLAKKQILAQFHLSENEFIDSITWYHHTPALAQQFDSSVWWIISKKQDHSQGNKK